MIRGGGSEWDALWARHFTGRAPRRELDDFLRSIQFGRGDQAWEGWGDWLSGVGLVGGDCVWIREWGREIVVLGLG